MLAAEQAVARYAHDAAVELYAQALADLDRVPPAAPPTRPGRRAGRLLARLSLSQLTAGAGIDALDSRVRALRLADEAGRDDLVVRVLTAWDLPTPWMNRSTAGTRESRLRSSACGWPDVPASPIRRHAVPAALRAGRRDQPGADRQGRCAASEAEPIARQLADPC